MIINDQIDVESFTSGNSIYNQYKDRWIYYLQSYLGGKDYTDAGHLTKYVNESAAEYNARCLTTPYENHCQSVISVYDSFLFREEPTRDLGLIQDTSEVEDIMKDCDFENRSFNAFMSDLHTWASVYGHAWVVVTQANVNAATLADQREQGVRPYMSMLTPLAVLDWQFERSVSGRYTLAYFKYVEDMNGDIQTIKEWTADLIKTTVVDKENNAVTSQEIVDNQLGYIPAVICYNKRTSVRGIGNSDIADIADLAKFIYNATSEVEQSIRLNTHPSLVKTPSAQAGIGAGSIIHVDETSDPNLKPYLLEFNGASVDSIYMAINHAVDAIDKIANTGGVRATESRTMSGVALETEFQLLNSRLSSKADNMQLAEENIWRIVCDYLGREWNGTIEYPGSFNIRDAQSEITQLKTAKETATSPAVLEQVDKQLLIWLEVEEEIDVKVQNQPDNLGEQ